MHISFFLLHRSPIIVCQRFALAIIHNGIYPLDGGTSGPNARHDSFGVDASSKQSGFAVREVCGVWYI